MKKKVSILGSTGSIGTQALQVCDTLGNIEVTALCANSNIALLEQQIRKYKPKIAAVMDYAGAKELSIRVADTGVKVLQGMDGFCEAATMNHADMVLTAVVGVAGLIPTISAIEAGKDIALANKETLVAGGSIVMPLAYEKGVKILPVDSEHSAVFQCLQGQTRAVKRIILTASGGPFFGMQRGQLANISVEQALKHPNWSMGAKITIDSASLMNKGLEVIEAKWLFDAKPEQIEVVVHRQSIIHSMVEFEDNSILAQLSPPDMKLPIGYAFCYPDRAYCGTQELNFLKYNTLTFEQPDKQTFKCLDLAYKALNIGGTMPAVLNAANEEAVSLFLNKKITFLDIPKIIEAVMDGHNVIKKPSLDDILACDKQAREYVQNNFNK